MKIDSFRRPGAALLALATGFAFAPAVHAEDESDPSALTDTIIVSGHPLTPLAQEQDPVDGHATAPDAARLVASLPGAALIDNGAISGQVQYRGLFSERLAIRVGGQSFQSGGPNAMDPPLHYAPTILLDSVSVSRGVAPVSQGPGLGGSIDASFKTVGFSTGTGLQLHADLAASYRSVDSGFAVGGVAGLSNDTVRINAIGSWETGDDYRYPGGTVLDSSYNRVTYGLSGGLRTNGNTLSLDFRRQETGASGNPPFPMDIAFFHTDFMRAGFDGTIAGHAVAIALSYTGVDHAMDNYSLRPPPAMTTMYRRTAADAQTFTGSVKVGFGPLTLGADASVVDRNVTIANPDNAAFFITSLNGIGETRVGGFAQLEGATGGWHGDAGVRIDGWHARMAAPLTGAAVPAMVQALAATTAASNRPIANTTWDAAIRLWREQGVLRPHFTISRKTRVPNAVERFSWLPTGASGGLADGNIYIGNTALRPEVAWAVEGGVDVVSSTFRFRPSAFYRRIDGYIQGTPVPMNMMPQIMIATMNGDSTPLRFSNVDAELYGFDGDIGWQIVPSLRFDATISYVRGKRRDIADNLYRIAPLNGRASLTYGRAGWSVTGEVVAAAAQRDVSASNAESPSPGWAIANVWFDLGLARGMRLSGGIENLFDRTYADHLAGVNRVMNSSVAPGQRLPGAGRGAFVRLGAAF